MTKPDRPRRGDDLWVLAVRWVAACIYTALSWGLCHDGTSPAEAVALAVAGAALIVLIVALGWILGGSEGDR